MPHLWEGILEVRWFYSHYYKVTAYVYRLVCLLSDGCMIGHVTGIYMVNVYAYYCDKLNKRHCTSVTLVSCRGYCLVREYRLAVRSFISFATERCLSVHIPCCIYAYLSRCSASTQHTRSCDNTVPGGVWENRKRHGRSVQ